MHYHANSVERKTYFSFSLQSFITSHIFLAWRLGERAKDLEIRKPRKREKEKSLDSLNELNEETKLTSRFSLRSTPFILTLIPNSEYFLYLSPRLPFL